MKKFTYFIASTIFSCLIFSCGHDNEITENTSSNDNETNFNKSWVDSSFDQMIDSISKIYGIINYDLKLSSWTISEFKNGEADSAIVFLPISLEDKFQKDGMPVVLSGTVYELPDSFLVNIRMKEGFKYYALGISAIDEDSVKANEIIGSWYLSERNGGLNMPVTFEANEIICRFYNNGILIVQDMRKADYVEYGPAGPHKYTLDEENGYIFIDNAKCYYTVNDNKLTIDTGSAWDGFVYILQKEDEKRND